MPLNMSELEALLRMAQRECRQPREQMRYLLRKEACKWGLLVMEQQTKQEEGSDGKTAVTGA